MDNVKQNPKGSELETNMFFEKNVNIKKEDETISEVDVQEITEEGILNTGVVLDDDILNTNRGLLCDLCKLSFQLKSVLISHMKLNHADIYSVKKQFKCPDDNTKFNLANHVRNRYACNICLKTYTTKGRLSTHARIHTGEKPYACDLCQKSYSYKHHLSEHRKVHTAEKLFACDVCQKSFSRKHALSRHAEVHTEERPYACDVCQMSFSRKHNLSRHTRIHAGEKPYACLICQKSFSRKYTLYLHTRIHTGEKPYACDVCHKSFSQKSYLLEHTMVHREKRYT